MFLKNSCDPKTLNTHCNRNLIDRISYPVNRSIIVKSLETHEHTLEIRKAETVLFQLPAGHGGIGEERRVTHWLAVDRGPRGHQFADAPLEWPPAERRPWRRPPQRQPRSAGAQNHDAETIGQVSFLRKAFTRRSRSSNGPLSSCSSLFRSKKVKSWMVYPRDR